MAIPVLDSKGLAAVTAAVASWAILIVVSRVLVAGYGLNPWLLAFVQMASGGAAMIAVAGRGPLPLAAIRRPHTWIYGVLRVLTAATFTAALAYGTSAEISVLSVLFIPVGIGFAWLLLGRRPSGADALGSLVVCAGIAGVAHGLPGGLIGPASLLMAISASATALGSSVAELHPDNQGDDRRLRFRLTGAVMLATAVVMLVAAVTISAADPEGAIAAAIPAAAIADPAIWIAGALVGVLLRGPSTYFTFRAIRMVGAENYLMGAALMPVLNLIGESVAAEFGIVAMPDLASWTMLSGIVGITGVVGIAARRWRVGSRVAA